MLYRTGQYRDFLKQFFKLFEKGCSMAAFLGAEGVLDNAPLPPYQFPNDIPVVRHYEERVLLSAQFPKAEESFPLPYNSANHSMEQTPRVGLKGEALELGRTKDPFCMLRS